MCYLELLIVSDFPSVSDLRLPIASLPLPRACETELPPEAEGLTASAIIEGRPARRATAEAAIERGAAGTATAAEIFKRGAASTAAEVLAERRPTGVATRRGRHKTVRLSRTDFGSRRHIRNSLSSFVHTFISFD